MTSYTPCISVFLHKRRRAIKGITALRAKEMPDVPLRATRDHDLALYRCFTRLAPRREEFVEIKMAVESHGFVSTVFLLETHHVFGGWAGGQELDVLTALAGLNSRYAGSVFVRGLRVEGYAFEVLTAVMALETLGMEA
jgi:hypothetical protein